ncbi:MAG TPA: helix-turn-helix domain-containing protein [Candidatus Saccharimonadales bacterium]|nr:helix-turn-helix domain-containing protein [Candidatus Saccharimonadales bacterium]
MKISKAKIERGEEAPAQVWDLRPDGKGGFKRRALDPEAFQRDQRMAWDKTITSTRHKLGLSQLAFANLLGISVRTLHHWEQGTRTPTGAARVLLRIAANNPDLVIKAAA